MRRKMAVVTTVIVVEGIASFLELSLQDKASPPEEETTMLIR